MSNVRWSTIRHIIEQLVLQQYGRDAYMCLACCSAGTTFYKGVELGLISLEELELARKDYGNMWNYVGD